jgi:hypothetical protein
MIPFSAPLQVRRDAQAGSYINGHWVEGKTQTLNIMATVEPLSGNDLLLLPEGERTKEAIRIYTDSELKTVDEFAKRKADVVNYFGKCFEVQVVKRWTQLIPHFACIAVNKTDLKWGD